MLQEALNAMEPTEREIIAMKHFEQLTISDISEVLQVPRATIGRRYLSAMKRLREVLKEYPDFAEE